MDLLCLWFLFVIMNDENLNMAKFVDTYFFSPDDEQLPLLNSIDDEQPALNDLLKLLQEISENSKFKKNVLAFFPH